jgi:hypothetical protein
MFNLDLYSVSSQKQQPPDRRVAPPGLIILIPSKLYKSKLNMLV